MLRPSAVVFVLVGFVAPAVAQTPSAPPPAKAPFVFEAGVQELRPLVNRCAAYLQRNILLDPRELQVVQGNARRQGGAQAPQEAADGLAIELQSPVVTDREACEELLQGLLWTHGLAIVPVDEAKGVYEVLAMGGQRAREITQRAPNKTVAEVLARPRLRSWVTVAMPLQHINATIATNALRPFFASTGNPSQGLTLGNVGNTSTILLCGPQDTVAQAIQLLQASDTAQAEGTAEQLTRLEQLAKRVAELESRLTAIDGRRPPAPAPQKKTDDVPAETR
jgi:hypothetical protein